MFAANGVVIHGWGRVRTDWLTIRPRIAEEKEPENLPLAVGM